MDIDTDSRVARISKHGFTFNEVLAKKTGKYNRSHPYNKRKGRTHRHADRTASINAFVTCVWYAFMCAVACLCSL